MPVIFTKPDVKKEQERIEAERTAQAAAQATADAAAAKEALARENEALRRQLLEAKQPQQQGDGTHLVVNGQVRKIGKKSHYLLDMLTLPEDK